LASIFARIAWSAILVAAVLAPFLESSLLDLVQLTFGELLILLNDGNGELGPPINFPLAVPPSFLAAGDLDGNGTPDLAIANSGICPELCPPSSTISLLFNQTVPASSPDSNRNGIPDECEGALFHRGDPNGDGKLDVLDPLFLLAFLFGDGAVPACRESADAQNDGRIDLADPLSLLRFLFLHGQAPAAPGPVKSACGSDPDPAGSPADLGCASYTGCF
jgi:hypothetical protein